MSLSPKMAAVKTSVLNFFKASKGAAVKTSMPATQMPLATPAMQVAPVASSMDVDVHLPGEIRDVLRKFEKEFEEMTSEYFAAVERMGQRIGDSFNALEFEPQIQVGDVVKCLDEIYHENQRKVTDFFEVERSAFATAEMAAAPTLKPLASTKPDGERKAEMAEVAAPKPPAVSNAKVDGIDVKATTAVAYAAIYVGRISKKVTNVQLQEVFDTNASVGRYYSKGIAKVLVPLDQLDQALSQDTSSISHGRKCRVAKWVAKAPSPRAHGHQAGRGREILSAAYIASEDSLMKGRARFVAEFLAAQNPGDGLQKNSLRGQRLYSQVASEKTTEMRIKSMEIAMRDMMRLLRSTK